MKQFATVTVIGRDKTGVIARVTNFLFEQGANIEALEEQVTGASSKKSDNLTFQPSMPLYSRVAKCVVRKRGSQHGSLRSDVWSLTSDLCHRTPNT